MIDQALVAKPRRETPEIARAAPIPRSGSRGRFWTGACVFGVGGMAVVALSGALTLGTVPRLKQQEALNAASSAAAAAPPRVNVVTARPMETDANRVLPGAAMPLLEASM